MLMLGANHQTEFRDPSGELEEVLKEQRGIATPQEEQSTGPPTQSSQKVHIEGFMAPDTYIAEDGLV